MDSRLPKSITFQSSKARKEEKLDSSRKEKWKQKSNRWFIFKGIGHFAKNYPNKRNQVVKMIQQLQAIVIESQNEDADIESLFS